MGIPQSALRPLVHPGRSFFHVCLAAASGTACAHHPKIWICQDHAPHRFVANSKTQVPRTPVPPPSFDMKQQVMVEAPKLMEHQLDKLCKRNVVLLGLTGAGKSLLACQLTQSQYFSTSDSMTSVTSKVEHKDIEFNKRSYRIIDTPGFFDTTMTPEDIAKALQEFANVAREGLVAIIIVVRNGRFTQENEAVVKFIEAVLGAEALEKYGVLIVTHTRKSSAELMAELKSLPESNLGRKVAEKMQGRVVGVESKRWRTWKTRGEIFDQIESLFELNEFQSVDCDMMNWGRVRAQLQLEYEDQTRQLREAHDEDIRLHEQHTQRLQNMHEQESAKLKDRVKQVENMHEQNMKQVESSMRTLNDQLDRERNDFNLKVMMYDHKIAELQQQNGQKQVYYIEQTETRAATHADRGVDLAAGYMLGATAVAAAAGGCQIQ